MKKIFGAILVTLFPLIALANDGSMSFTPPPSDYSVVFLANIFGVVDGVLHGSGSQIMGAIFTVFNSAVLALGGIIIMYTLMVSTMNTAHEGQMLGQKWSSIWIPIRSTVGLSLLIPKASGYCLMQVFVMWIVVQGVGAADKVWDAALNYLNRGGVVVQPQLNPSDALIAAQSMANSGDQKGGFITGAQTILAGQVCMLGLQKQLESQYQSYMTQKQSNSGPCSGQPSSEMAPFCNNMVPDFINSVSTVGAQQANLAAWRLSVTMPNFSSDSVYAGLNGICGTITWFPLSGGSLYSVNSSGVVESKVSSSMPTITQADLQTASMSRSIALQQMYADLANVAQMMVSNSPGFGPKTNDTENEFSTVAEQQFGVPMTALGQVCSSSTTANCISWGPSSVSSNSTTLFNGTEFQGALADYNGIMLPTLTLIQQARNSSVAKQAREFITNASTQGWLMAGSYFFYVVNLNQQAMANGAAVVSGGGPNQSGTQYLDVGVGLEESKFNTAVLQNAFGDNGTCKGTYSQLCTWLNGDSTRVAPIISLINGQGVGGSSAQNEPKLNGSLSVVNGLLSSTVYGYTTNATILSLPGQPGQKPMQFSTYFNLDIDTSPYQMQSVDFHCQGFMCLSSALANIFYNDVFLKIYNFLLGLISGVINGVLITFLSVPLDGMAAIFQQGLSTIDQPGVNPIVALANMGTYYINFAANLWIMLIELSIATVLIPVFGIFIFALISLVMPLLLAWVGVMVSIGFVTAYYVPMLPYMIFTFGSIAWFMAVIEAMVAAPIVALGVTHPEGHDAFGKGEQAIMILMNVFLRPSMMIIGYIAGISLSYVGVWLINAGFDNAIGFIQGSSTFNTQGAWTAQPVSTAAGSISGGYTGWAGTYAYFFSILIYTSLYLTVVQKSFTLIVALPDKVLRWIGGQPESIGQEAAQWTEDTKKQVGDAGDKTSAAQAAMDKQLTGYAQQGISSIKKSASQSGGGNVSASGGE